MQGQPARVPSPWMEKKTSLTTSAMTGADDYRASRLSDIRRAAAGRFPATAAPQEPPAGPAALAHLVEEVAGDLLGRRALAREVRVRVHVGVVEPRRHLADRLLEVLEVDHHADAVQRVAGGDRFHAP